MRRNGCSGGFSLVEIVIASAFLTVIIFGTVSIFQKHVTLVKKNVLLTRATTMAEELSSKIKSQPFDAVFSYDSSIQHPPKPVCCTGSFDPAAYLIDIASSPMKPVLDDFLTKIKDAHFDRFRIDVIYERRNSSNSNGGTDEFIPWSFSNGSTIAAVSPGIAGGCAAADSTLCFQDLNSDKDYWDVVDGKPETPFTGLKLVTVTIFKSGEPVGVKQGNILSRWGLSGQEVASGQAPLKLQITQPNGGSGTWAFQVTPQTKNALELRTRRTYPTSMWGSSNGVVRIDDWNVTVNLNQQCNLWGSNIASSNPFAFSAWNRYLRVVGVTDASQSGNLQIFDRLNTSAFPGNNPDESVFFTPTGNGFVIDGNSPNKFTTLSSPSFLMRDGTHRLWTRKQSQSYNTVFSPFDVRFFNVDNGIPKMTTNYISAYSWPYGGRTPVVAIAISDYFQGNGSPTVKPSGVSPYVTWAGVFPTNPLGPPMQTWPAANGAPAPSGIYKMSFSGGQYLSTTTVMLRDPDNYPWLLDYDTEYKVIWEWGDYVGYKSSATYLFKIPDNSSETTPPEIDVNTTLSSSYSPLLLRSSTADPTPVQKGAVYSFLPLWFRDLESGINFKTLKIEICPDNLPGGAMHLNNQTPGCRTLVHHKNENVNPTSSTYGGQISYSAMLARSAVKIAFTSPGAGVLAGLDFTVGSVWQIRASVTNWAGVENRTPNDYWRFVIVP